MFRVQDIYRAPPTRLLLSEFTTSSAKGLCAGVVIVSACVMRGNVHFDMLGHTGKLCLHGNIEDCFSERLGRPCDAVRTSRERVDQDIDSQALSNN